MEDKLRLDWENWQVALLNPRHTQGEHEELRSKAYQAWKKTWSTALHEIGESTNLPSDNFTRQDEIFCFFYKGECAGMFLHSFFDNLTLDRFIEDSYFAPWPELARRKLKAQGPRVIACSHYTVVDGFRKNQFHFSTGDILLHSLLFRFLETDYDVVTGNLRNSRGVNEICRRYGATTLMKEVDFHGEKNDLVGFFRNNADSVITNGHYEEIRNLWEARVDLSGFSKRRAA